MGIRDRLSNALGGGTPSRLPAQATTKQIEAHKKAKAKEAAASKERSRRHKFTVARYGDDGLIPFDHD